MTDPIVTTVERVTDQFDEHTVADSRELADEHIHRHIPSRYTTATVTDNGMAAWVHSLVQASVRTSRGSVITLRRGPSVLLTGPTGTGKTHQAYGALRALAASGVQVRWRMTTAVDLYSHLRPRSGVDPETEFAAVARVPLLVLDDLGAAKASEWVEETTYRLINHRYEHELPTLVTTNVAPKDLAHALGERVSSRLTEMAERVVLSGVDRRVST